VGIGAKGAKLAVTRLQVWRDIYYIADSWQHLPTSNVITDLDNVDGRTMVAMARDPKPWYRSQTDWWMAVVDGVRHKRAQAKANRENSKANVEYTRIVSPVMGGLRELRAGSVDGAPAMIAIDLNTVGSWAERHGLAYTSYADLAQKPEVRGLVAEEIAKGNLTLPDATKVLRFLLLTKDLDADDAEVTRTRKVRRRYVVEKYANVIEAFYSGASEVELTSTVTYEDGRQATVRSSVRIEDVADRPAELAHV
jgi:hypothetical protein